MRTTDKLNDAAFQYYEPLQRIERFLAGHYRERITLSRAAAIAGFEPTYFSKFFHAKTGMRFRDWMSLQRVRRAQQLIASHDYRITQLALQVGFRDVRTFERAFKKWTGDTPKSYRDSMRPRPAEHTR